MRISDWSSDVCSSDLNLQIFRKVIVPGILPYLITGLKLGIGYAWRALIAAEMLAASSFGLGFMIFDAAEYMSMDIIYGGIVLIGVLGYLLENVLLGRLDAVTINRKTVGEGKSVSDSVESGGRRISQKKK